MYQYHACLTLNDLGFYVSEEHYESPMIIARCIKLLECYCETSRFEQADVHIKHYKQS